MGIDPSAVLALISDLTSRLAAAEQERDQLRAHLGNESAGREAAARDLEKVAVGYENQFGTDPSTPGGTSSGLLHEAARIARDGFGEDELIGHSV